MSSPAVGMFYPMWLRLRWTLAGMLAYVLFLALAVQLFSNSAPFVMIASLVPTAAMGHWLTVLTLGPADLGVRGSGFPRDMLVFPLSTRSLIGWPMLYGSALNALLWLLFATTIFIPAGIPVPMLWPAAIFASATSWLQAVGWAPFPSPFARVPALVVSLTPLIGLGSWAGLYPESNVVSTLVVACSLIWTWVAYLFGAYGLARARGGDDGAWFRIHSLRRATQVHRLVNRELSVGTQVPDKSNFRSGSRLSTLDPRLISVRPPFRSALAAQLWHECRRNAIFLPIMLGMISVPMLPMLCLQVLNGRDNQDLMFGPVKVTPIAIVLGQWLAIPLLICMTMGSAAGKFDPWGKEQMPAFFAIRPLDTWQFIRVKFCATAISALFATAIVAVLFGIWAALEASPLNPRESLVRQAVAGGSPHVIAVAFAAPIGLFAVMWRDLVIGMWPTLTGRKWLSVVVGITMLLLLSLAGAAGVWTYSHPSVQPRLVAMVPWIVGSLLVLKLAAAVVVVSALLRKKLIPLRTMEYLLVGWVVVAASLLGAIAYFVSPTWYLTAGVVLSTPWTRIVAAPLALYWNRHR